MLKMFDIAFWIWIYALVLLLLYEILRWNE